MKPSFSWSGFLFGSKGRKRCLIADCVGAASRTLLKLPLSRGQSSSGVAVTEGKLGAIVSAPGDTVSGSSSSCNVASLASNATTFTSVSAISDACSFPGRPLHRMSNGAGDSIRHRPGRGRAALVLSNVSLYPHGCSGLQSYTSW